MAYSRAEMPFSIATISGELKKFRDGKRSNQSEQINDTVQESRERLSNFSDRRCDS
jgi:hypothetical protein